MRKTQLVKTLLALTAFVMAVMLFMWPKEETQMISVEAPVAEDAEELGSQLKQATVEDLGETVMVEPRFSGEDDKNRRWELSAKEARQSGKLDNEEIYMDGVEAKAQSESGKELKFKAEEGYYARSSEEIKLEGNVEISGYGITLETEKIRGNLVSSTVIGDAPVTIKSDDSELKANKFNIHNNGELIRLEGNVKGRFYVKDKKPEGTKTNE